MTVAGRVYQTNAIRRIERFVMGHMEWYTDLLDDDDLMK